MSAVHALNGHPVTSHPASPAGPDTVKNPLTRRVLRAYARRVATGDVEALTLMLGLSAEIDTAISQAVTGLREFGYSWAEIGSRLGITRQAAQQRWGGRA